MQFMNRLSNQLETSYTVGANVIEQGQLKVEAWWVVDGSVPIDFDTLQLWSFLKLHMFMVGVAFMMFAIHDIRDSCYSWNHYS